MFKNKTEYGNVEILSLRIKNASIDELIIFTTRAVALKPALRAACTQKGSCSTLGEF